MRGRGFLAPVSSVGHLCSPLFETSNPRHWLCGCGRVVEVESVVQIQSDEVREMVVEITQRQVKDVLEVSKILDQNDVIIDSEEMKGSNKPYYNLVQDLIEWKYRDQ